MTIEDLATKLKDWLSSLVHNDWFGTLLTVLLFVGATALASHLLTTFLRKILKSKKGPLPSVSIFINIGRVAIWVVGISIILSSCFNVNVGAAVTALGVGGIAISLGFQETLSNLIGGLQIIMSGLVEPGDRIKVGNFEGVVRDVSWRHTTMRTVQGETVVIPNSVINTEALVKLAPERDFRLNITLMPGREKLENLISDIEKQVKASVSKVAVIAQDPQIRVTALNGRSYAAILTFSVEEGAQRSQVIDAALKATASSSKAKAMETPDRDKGSSSTGKASAEASAKELASPKGATEKPKGASQAKGSEAKAAAAHSDAKGQTSPSQE